MNPLFSDAKAERKSEAEAYYKNPAHCPVCDGRISFLQFKKGNTTCSILCHNLNLAQTRKGRPKTHPTPTLPRTAKWAGKTVRLIAEQNADFHHANEA